MCIWIPVCQVSSYWIFLFLIQINDNTSTSTNAAIAFKYSQNNGKVCEFIIKCVTVYFVFIWKEEKKTIHGK